MNTLSASRSRMILDDLSKAISDMHQVNLILNGARGHISALTAIQRIERARDDLMKVVIADVAAEPVMAGVE